MLGLGAAWCWAASIVLVKRFPVTAHPLAVVTWQLLLGAVCMAIGMVVFEGWPRPHAVSASVSLAIGYNVASQAISQTIWFDILGRAPAALAALGVLLVPAIAVLGSFIILHETPTLMDTVGLALITCASLSVQFEAFSQWRQTRLQRLGTTD
jgi:drug/metabolite transporter (DMT)-like permease